MHTTTRPPLTGNPAEQRSIVDVWHQRHDREPAYQVGCYAVTSDPDVPPGVKLLVEGLDAQGMIGVDALQQILRDVDAGHREVLARAAVHIFDAGVASSWSDTRPSCTVCDVALDPIAVNDAHLQPSGLLAHAGCCTTCPVEVAS